MLREIINELRNFTAITGLFEDATGREEKNNLLQVIGHWKFLDI